MSEQTQKAPQPRGGGGGGMGMGGPPGMGGGVIQKPNDFNGTVKKLVAYLRPHSAKIAIVVAFAMLSSIFSIAGPKILGNATTKLVDSIVAKMFGLNLYTDLIFIRDTILLLLGLYLLSFVFAYVQSFIMTGVSMKVTYELRQNISHKINRMPLNYFDSTSHGDVMSRITNDVDTVSQTLNQSLTQIITSFTTVIGVLVMMLTINWIMTLVVLLIIPASGILIGSALKMSQKFFKEQQAVLGAMNGHVEEMYSGHNVMKAFNGEARSIEQFNEQSDKLYGTAWKAQFLSGLIFPIMSFISNFEFVAVCILGGFMAINGAIKVGDIQAFIQYVRSFMQPISQLANISNTLQSTVAAAERVFEFLEQDEEVSDKNSAQLQKVVGQVTFKNVKFGYNEDKIIINNFTEDVAPGQKVAIVGPTGAGKTTMIKLLMRFYDVTDGAILIDGQDIRNLSRSDLRSMFGMVLQDTWLYNTSIMENIRYGRLNATDEEVYRAMEQAHADGFVRALPDGYKMVINEDASNISQGQKQLLTIARAILADPKILILDEATSSVDTRTEVLIQKAMAKMMIGRTSFVIAHRLSTIRDADIILVMKDGDVVEQGNHDELLAANGFYAGLYNSQFDEGES